MGHRQDGPSLGRAALIATDFRRTISYAGSCTISYRFVRTRMSVTYGGTRAASPLQRLCDGSATLARRWGARRMPPGESVRSAW